MTIEMETHIDDVETSENENNIETIYKKIIPVLLK